MNEYALINGQWQELTSQSADGLWGGQYIDTFANNNAAPLDTTPTANGSAQFPTAPAGEVDHFGDYGSPTGPASGLQGVFVEETVTAKDPSLAAGANTNLVAQVGDDYYLNDAANNNPVGESDWSALPNDTPTTLYFTSVNPSTLASNPPPGISS